MYMEQKKIDRINELAKKSKAEGLTDAEKAEQKGLRVEYIEAMKASLLAELENTYIVNPDGTKVRATELKKRRETLPES